MGTGTKKSIIFGIVAGFSLLVFYFLVLTLTQGFSHAAGQFFLLWYLISPLVIGFGIQVFLYSYIRYQIQERKINGAAGGVAASGGVSTVSMIACCAHHLADIAPFLGLTAVFLFLAEYQIFFLLFGVASNIFGIILMLEIIKKMNLGQECGILAKSNKMNWKKIKIIATAVIVLALTVSFLSIKNKKEKPINTDSNLAKITLPTKNNSEGNLSIDATPVDFSFSKPLRFEISFNTHQGALDFDLAEISFLTDDKENKYLPLKWEGEAGGHHLSGILIFPQMPENTKMLKLIIQNIYNVENREFLWNL